VRPAISSLERNTYMSSRRPVRQLVVAILLGVLVGGGLMAVTPAGAELSQAVATNWKKIWKKNLKPLADKRYYTKAQSDTRYQSKGAYEAAGSGYSKAESDAKYAAAGSGYSKAESDAKYAPYPAVMRGMFSLALNATSTTYVSGSAISFGYVLPAAPVVHYIAPGGTPPAECPGTAQRPDALPGHLCAYGAAQTNISNVVLANRNTGIGLAEPFGAGVWAQPAAAGHIYLSGTWAVRPGSVSTNPPAAVAPKPESLITTQ
jgi:hypothetical protein